MPDQAQGLRELAAKSDPAVESASGGTEVNRRSSVSSPHLSPYAVVDASTRTGLTPAPAHRIVLIGPARSGKTSVAAALAVALRARGARVVALDGSPLSPDLHYALQARTRPGIAGLLSGTTTVRSALSPGLGGVRVLALERELANLGAQPSPDRLRLAHALDSVGDQCDFMVLDTAGDITPASRPLVMAADLAVAVADPSRSSILSACAIVRLALHLTSGLRVWCLINRVRSSRESCAVDSILSRFADPLQGRVRNAGTIADVAGPRFGWSLVESAVRADLRTNFDRLAQDVLTDRAIYPRSPASPGC